MLEEVIALFLSLFSLFINETPSVSFQEQISSDTEEGASTVLHQWLPYINKEYETLQPNEELNSPLLGRESTAYIHGLVETFSLNKGVFGNHFKKVYGQVSAQPLLYYR